MRAWRPIVYPADMAYGKRVSRTAVLEARRDRVMSLVLAGATTRQIARQLGFSHATIARDIKARLDAKAAGCPDTAEYRELHRQRINRLLATWWGPATGSPSTEDAPAVPPNPMAMDRVLRLLEREARLLGLDMPARIDHSGKVQVDQKPDLATLTDDDLQTLRGLFGGNVDVQALRTMLGIADVGKPQAEDEDE